MEHIDYRLFANWDRQTTLGEGVLFTRACGREENTLWFMFPHPRTCENIQLGATTAPRVSMLLYSLLLPHYFSWREIQFTPVKFDSIINYFFEF